MGLKTAAVVGALQPKTAWGDPDLQGLWPATDMIDVPTQRPANFGTRSVLTDEEYQQRVRQAKQTAESDSEQYAKEGAAPGINPPSYWLERGKANYQASLVVETTNLIGNTNGIGLNGGGC
jgi:hypothetical protein